ncbi:hypothetical protein C3L33_18806, partial [Rhododendron williamsianum]
MLAIRLNILKALNSILTKWDVLGLNGAAEPCTGSATDSTRLEDYNPGIKCDCNGTVCHITGLKVYAKGVAGQIPDELWSLAYLTHLNLAKNNLTGPVSPSIGNLTRMQYMNLDHNSFSGELPKELGNLTELLILYMDSSGVSGPIPLTFAALQNMQFISVLGAGGSMESSLTGIMSEVIEPNGLLVRRRRDLNLCVTIAKDWKLKTRGKKMIFKRGRKILQN